MTEPSIKTADDCRAARLESDCPRYQAQVLHDAEQEIRRLHKRIDQLEKAGVPERQFPCGSEGLRTLITDERIREIDDETHFHESPDWSVRFARAIEREICIGGAHAR